MSIKINKAMNSTLFPVTEIPATFMKAEGENRTLVTGTGYKFIVREDTGDVLSCMTDEYKLVDNRTVVEKVDTLLSGNGAELCEAVSYSNGQRSVWKWNFPNTEVKVGKGDLINPQLIVANSYDGSVSVNIMGGAFRLICLNGLTIGNVLTSKKAVHKNGNTTIDNIEQTIKDTVNMLIQIFNDEFPVLTSTKLRRKHIVDVTKIIPSQYLESFTKYCINNNMNTYWDLLNACTYIATHVANRDRQSIYIMENQIYPTITRLAKA